ncbi:hypothetical protein K1T71_010967 [Dendrolimus kikuchii]|uniref:Uncharacterized protein n=1 Tax=Dendrolimus kikuchii TaxID=765133 RepID=A0ACC1CQJ1_9NEOP|nr:hypothetical protein K1T71_010967 [Dendrolimus kikuchii]
MNHYKPVISEKPSDNTKEKCRNFLANLLDLSSKEPPAVERNVRNLIQELIDAQVEPEEFCDRLEKLLNASPQPCLIGFLKKSLPLLRQSLVTKELTIEGINPPAPHVAFSTIPAPSQSTLTTSNIQMTGEESSGPTLTQLMPPAPSKTQAPPLVSTSKPINVLAKPSTSGQVRCIAKGSVLSCKDEFLIPLSAMQARIRSAVAKYELEESPVEVASLLCHAVHERLKNLIEKLAVIAQHRIDMVVKTDPRYEVTQDVKGQLKFLEELDRVDKKRREDSERELLLRAAKSRSKNEDPEQAKLKAKAKEMQRAELEELRQREANLTALQAIGPRKKPRLDGPSGSGDGPSTSTGAATTGISGRSQLALRTRLKRINARDLLFLMEQEHETAHSVLLYKFYLR